MSATVTLEMARRPTQGLLDLAWRPWRAARKAQ
jgi:hypothetical protein